MGAVVVGINHAVDAERVVSAHCADTLVGRHISLVAAIVEGDDWVHFHLIAADVAEVGDRADKIDAYAGFNNKQFTIRLDPVKHSAAVAASSYQNLENRTLNEARGPTFDEIRDWKPKICGTPSRNIDLNVSNFWII